MKYLDQRSKILAIRNMANQEIRKLQKLGQKLGPYDAICRHCDELLPFLNQKVRQEQHALNRSLNNRREGDYWDMLRHIQPIHDNGRGYIERNGWRK